MEAESNWLLVLKDTLLQAGAAVGRRVPNIIGALVVIVTGWLLAKLLRTLSHRGLRGLVRLSYGLLRSGMAGRPRIQERSIAALGAIVFWTTILLFLTAATQVLGRGVFTEWLSSVVAYLPALLAGLLILIAGFVFSLLAKDLVTAAANSAHVAYAELLGRSVLILIFSMAVVIGIEQVGINVTFLVVIVAISLGMIFGGMALAIGLGARQLVANILATHYVRQKYQIGEHISIGALQGRISHINSVSLEKATPLGRRHVPTARVLSESSARTEAPPDHDQRSGP